MMKYKRPDLILPINLDELALNKVMFSQCTSIQTIPNTGKIPAGNLESMFEGLQRYDTGKCNGN